MASSVVAQYASPLFTSSLVVAIMVFMIVFAFVWILCFSFKPGFVCVDRPCDDDRHHKGGDVDTSKCLVTTFFVSLVAVALMWMFRTCSCK